jgi:hypothetical protein
MPDVTVHKLTDRARHAIIALHSEYKQRLNFAKFALYSMPQGPYLKTLSDEYESKLQAIIREGTEETRNDRYVRVKCPECNRIEQIAGDVERWTCICGPVERMAFQTYEEG